MAVARPEPSPESSKEVWLPLLEYSVQTGVSMSTLRRHIKSQRIRFKIDDGKYWVPLDSSAASPAAPSEQKFMPPASDVRLQADLRRAREEIAELKTLIAYYEESLGARGN